VLVIVVFVLVTQVAAALVTRQPQPILDWFATVTTILVVLMFLWPPQFHYHFAAFLTPWLALTLALPVSRLLAGIPRGTASPAAKRQLGWAAVGVLTDQVSVTLAANRFVSDVPGCSQMVDSVGTDLALSNGLKPFTGAGYVPAVAAAWNQAFSHAQYVILTATNTRRVAWTPALKAYLADHFVQVSRSPRLTLYVRKGLHVR
jgi:hypothetical protein